MSPDDYTAQAQAKMQEAQQLTKAMQDAVAKSEDNIGAMRRQIADIDSKILEEQRTIDREATNYRNKIDTASKEAQRYSVQASDLARRQAEDAARAAR